MKTIALTQGYVAQVSDKDYRRCMVGINWYACVRSRVVYAVRHKKTPKGWRTEYLHIFITGKKGIDHKDHNGLNCQRRNLRRATSTQNSGNRRKNPSGTSKYKGVSWSTEARKWYAQIKIKGKSIRLGLFVEEVNAARAYDGAARQRFGSFALTNFKEK